MKNNPEKKSNFVLALDEIMKGKSSQTGVQENEDTKVVDAITNDDEKTEARVNNTEDETIETMVTNDETEKIEKRINKNETSIILGDVIIDGSIKSKSNLIIKGRINGDVESSGNVSMSGHVDGNVRGASLISLDGSIHGNISGESLVTVSKDSKVLGDIRCKKLELDGNVIGNINTTGSLTIGSNSIIKGNIVSRSISILEGAKVRGNLEVIDDDDGQDNVQFLENN